MLSQSGRLAVKEHPTEGAELERSPVVHDAGGFMWQACVEGLIWKAYAENQRAGMISGRARNWVAALLFLAAACLGGPGRRAEGQLRWNYPPKKAPMRVRLVAIAISLPRSSFFKSAEVFVAETEISHEEWGLIKLVFSFLPYEPRLSESGFDYSVVHEVTAWRDENCDETVAQLTQRSLPNRHEPLIYSRNVPREDLDRRKIPLRCYETDAYDYKKSSFEPIAPPPNPQRPVLKARPRPESDDKPPSGK